METLGFDENRGDSITVKSSPFVDTLEPISIPWYESGTFLSKKYWTGMMRIWYKCVCLTGKLYNKDLKYQEKKILKTKSIAMLTTIK